MGFVVFIIVLAALANLIGDISDFISDYSYWIGIAIAALAGYRFVRQKFDDKEEEQKRAQEETDRRRMAKMASEVKPLGDDDGGEEDSYFSNIQQTTR